MRRASIVTLRYGRVLTGLLRPRTENVSISSPSSRKAATSRWMKTKGERRRYSHAGDMESRRAVLRSVARYRPALSRRLTHALSFYPNTRVLAAIKRCQMRQSRHGRRIRSALHVAEIEGPIPHRSPVLRG